MSVSPILTLGYGSFGSVNLLPTLGYGIGVSAETTIFGSSVVFAGERKRLIHGDRERLIAGERKRTLEGDRQL